MIYNLAISLLLLCVLVLPYINCFTIGPGNVRLVPQADRKLACTLLRHQIRLFGGSQWSAKPRTTTVPSVPFHTPPAAAAATTTEDKPAKKLKADVIEAHGRVTEALQGATFRVVLEPSKKMVLCTISGRIRKNFVRILVGDMVTIELSIYDLTKGRITFRKK